MDVRCAVIWRCSLSDSDSWRYERLGSHANLLGHASVGYSNIVFSLNAGRLFHSLNDLLMGLPMVQYCE